MERRYHVFVAREHHDEVWAYQGADFVGTATYAAECAYSAAREPFTGDDGPYMFGEDSVAYALVVPAIGDGFARAFRVTEHGVTEFPSYWLTCCPIGLDPTKFRPESDALGHDVEVPSDELTELARMKAGLESISASGGANPDGYLTERIVEIREAMIAAHGMLEDARLSFAAGNGVMADGHVMKAMETIRRAVPEESHA